VAVTQDEFEAFAGPYVLGILSAQERSAFQAHLETCEQCRVQVAELSPLPGLLALAPAQAYAPEFAASDPVVVLIAAARAQRVRRRWVGAVTATLVAACLILFTALLVQPHGSAPAKDQSVAMTALVSAPIHASADVSVVAWGTSIRLRCTYDDGRSYPAITYELLVTDRSGNSNMVGTWNVVPGKVTTFAAGTAVPLADIKSITVATVGGTNLLRLSY
jgi:hypothetical protein